MPTYHRRPQTVVAVQYQRGEILPFVEDGAVYRIYVDQDKPAPMLQAKGGSKFLQQGDWVLTEDGKEFWVLEDGEFHGLYERGMDNGE